MGAVAYRKKLLIFGVLVGVIGLIAFSPTIYATVEPHITINMDPGQTTKPLQIINENGTEVFSVDPDGSFTSANVVVLQFEQSDLVVVPASLNQPTINQLAVWQIVKDPTLTHGFPVAIWDGVVYGVLKPTTIGNCFCVETGWYRSSDTTFSPTGMSWSTIDVIEAKSSLGVFASDLEINESNTISSSVNFIAFGTSNPFVGSGAGEVKDFSGTLVIHLPLGQTMKRVQ